VARIVKHLRRRGLLPALESSAEDEGADAGGLSSLAASAVSGQSAPAGPEWRSLTERAAALARAGLARVRQAAVREPGRLYAARGHARGGDGHARARGALQVRPASGRRAGAHHAWARRSRAHHPEPQHGCIGCFEVPEVPTFRLARREEALCRRDRRGRHGSAVAALPVGGVGAASAAAYGAILRGARPGQQAALARRAEARSCAGQRRRDRDRDAEARRLSLPSVGGAAPALLRPPDRLHAAQRR
jgi:hypothetical protein